MSFCLPCGLTVQQIIDGIGEAAELGLTAIGAAEFIPLVQAAEKLAEDGATMIQNGPSAQEVLTGEVDAEQAAGDAAEAAKFPKP